MSTKRAIWIVRHGERVDNIDKTWKQNNPDKWDDPGLSPRGHTQAREVGLRLSNENIDYIFCSPFTRCVETVQGIVSCHPSPPAVYVEPGFMENLCSCKSPPGHPSLEDLKKVCPRVDDRYLPVYATLPPEGAGHLGCGNRISVTLKAILKKFSAGNILIVSHGTPIANMHITLFGSWKYAGQCTLAKVDDNYGEYKLAYFNNKTHLSHPFDLREDEVPVPR